MKVIIVGCGRMGYALAKQLSEENHDVTVIDTRADKLERTLAVLDIQGVEGNGTSFRVQQEAGVKECDMMVAVTGQDEVNLLCCLIARRSGIQHAIARVQNPIYNEEIQYLSDELGLSMTINPQLACARNIAKLIEVPGALEITTFAKGRIDMVRLPIPKDSPVDGMTIVDFANKISNDTLVTAIERDGDVIIPNGRTKLLSGDYMYVILRPAQIVELLRKLGIKTKPIRSVLIAGGGSTAYYLAAQLSNLPIDVKIIEQDHARCEQLSGLLPKAMIIEGNASDRQVLMEEGITEKDAMVALTNMDEENLILSMFTSKVSKAKTITKLNTISFDEVLSDLPVGVVVSPKQIAAKSILQYVRALENTHGSNVETLHRILNERVEVLEFKVRGDSKVTNTPLMELKLKKNLLVCGILRNGRLITPGGKDEILPGDNVIIVTTVLGLKDIGNILE
ncbi:MAG: Trk system potassium transporter TrkA [Lachnospiraceae bacterium]|nr:Trk system potassium transporter TrkA [Lachnospiraceae bacterium]